MTSPLKRFLPASLFGRSLLILIIPVLLIQVITTYVFYDRHWDRMTGRLAIAVSGEIAVMAHLLETDIGSLQARQVQRDMQQHLGLEFNFVPGGSIPAEKSSHKMEESMVVDTLQKVLPVQLKRPFHISVNLPHKKVIVSVQLENGVLMTTLPERRLFSSSSYIFLLWMIGVSTLLLIVAVIFMRNQIKPIRRLALAAERLGKGRDVPFFRPQGAREVRQAAQAFLEMRERINRQISQRTTMLAGVSHDLRTPLTRIKLQLAMMPESADTKALQEDLNHMEKMIEGYLDFAKGEGEEEPQRTDLALLLGRVVDASKDAKTRIDIRIKDDLRMMLRPVAMERCLTNLLNNARKYADEIIVEARRSEDVISVIIDDNGPGISEDKYEDVFRPFYRVDDSRNTKTGGVGLGLPIAAEIVHAHGGEITLDKSPQGGLRVNVTLPI